MFTFLPSFARGTGLSIVQMGQLLSVRDMTGLGAPVLGRVADRRGTGPVMAITGTMAAVGLLLSVFSTAGLIVGFVMMGIGKVGFDVALNAWIADEVSYERRARAFGLMELTWAAAALIGLPLSGLIIDRFDWRAVLISLGIFSLLVNIRVHQVVDRPTTPSTRPRYPLTLSPRVVVTLLSLGLLTLASQLLFVSHGLWLDESHGLNPASIGSVVIVFGLIEAVGTLTTSAVTDNLGKRNSVLAGSILLFAGTTTLALWSELPLVAGLILLGAAFLGFEFAFVSSLPLIAELVPEARAQVIGLSLGFGTVVRAIGSTVGTLLYTQAGFTGVMTLAASTTAVGFVLVVFVVREPVTTPRAPEVLK